MKRPSFRLLAVLAGGLLFANPSLGQTRSPVADTNPAEYVTSQERTNIRQEATRLINGGVVLVRLNRDQYAQADLYRDAFRQEFTLAPVYLFPSNKAENILNGDYTSLEPISLTMNRPVQPGNYLIVDVDPGNYATAISSSRNETLWRATGSTSAGRRNKQVDAVALRRSVAKLNRRIAHFAAQSGETQNVSAR